jgi:TonB family protein
MRSSTVVTVFTVVLGSSAASAQYRCDCTSVVDTCTAEVAARGSWLEIKTDHAQCVRVDYFVDGQPFVSVVVDGEDREDWLARTANPKIMVQSCQVCRDNGPAATVAAATPRTAAAPTEAPSTTDAGLQPLIAGVPEYPPAAQARGVRGYVEVEFTVNAAGNVENPRVVAAQPGGIFDSAALVAIARRRYAEDLARAPQTLKERVEFQPERGSTAVRADLEPAAGPRNQCVREDAVYNYGEMVDVGLINACTEPLLVFGCAVGTGKNFGRWVCSDSEQRGDVLVPARDRRLGNRYAAGNANDIRTYTYTDSYSVTRAPNSQYWWVACLENDGACRDGARQWTRAVSGQSASVDPADRSPIVVARSY